MELSDGSRIAVIGGGPAGTFTSYFLLRLAKRAGLRLDLDIYEWRDFSRPGPAGCNMCGGIVSESLVQLLATEGILLPPDVVQRGIDSYVLHTAAGQVRIATPLEEKRIAALYRGSGPKDARPGQCGSLDAFLLNLACKQGAHHIQSRVEELAWEDGRPRVTAKDGRGGCYDLLVGAIGVNTSGHKLFESLGFRYKQPKTTKTSLFELHVEGEGLRDRFGGSVHVFLPSIRGIEFAAIIPKGDYLTVCMLGDDIGEELVARFMNAPDVRDCLGSESAPDTASCRCFPRMNVGEPRHMYADRVVMVGDCGVSRLFKDGIGAAYRAAKACATTAVFHGVSKEDFDKHYRPVCRRLQRDNRVGKILFMGVGLFRQLVFVQRAIMRITRKEQAPASRARTMSTMVWDTFTGSAPYADVMRRGLKPGFALSFLCECVRALCVPAARDT